MAEAYTEQHQLQTKEASWDTEFADAHTHLGICAQANGEHFSDIMTHMYLLRAERTHFLFVLFVYASSKQMTDIYSIGTARLMISLHMDHTVWLEPLPSRKRPWSDHRCARYSHMIQGSFSHVLQWIYVSHAERMFTSNRHHFSFMFWQCVQKCKSIRNVIFGFLYQKMTVLGRNVHGCFALPIAAQVCVWIYFYTGKKRGTY